MIEVTEPQVWTLIGMFGAAIFGMLGIVSTMFVQVLKSEISAAESRLTSRIDLLDRDIQALTRHVFGDPGS
ncbi:MAG TPA: hypothetical protein VJ782_04280 [Aeromicrobium sp.]|nr:hypothetical protein [Aeromicrobium sp.]